MKTPRRAVIQIPLKDIVTSKEDKKKDILEIVLEGDQYINWYPGSAPMVIIGARSLSDKDFIKYLCQYAETQSRRTMSLV